MPLRGGRADELTGMCVASQGCTILAANSLKTELPNQPHPHKHDPKAEVQGQERTLGLPNLRRLKRLFAAGQFSALHADEEATQKHNKQHTAHESSQHEQWQLL